MKKQDFIGPVLCVGVGFYFGRKFAQLKHNDLHVEQDRELYQKIIDGYDFINVAMGDIAWFSQNMATTPPEELIKELAKKFEFTLTLGATLPQKKKEGE